MSGSSSLSRRGFLGLAAAATAVPLLAACNVSGSSNTGGSSGDASGELKFWDMPWGSPEYNTTGEKIIAGYTPASGFGKASLPDHPVERLLPDVLLRDRLQDRTGGVLRRRIPGVPAR